jgi:hypothetical protein
VQSLRTDTGTLSAGAAREPVVGADDMGPSNEDVIARTLHACGGAMEPCCGGCVPATSSTTSPHRSPMAAGTYLGREAVLALWHRQKAHLGGQRSWRA